VDRLGARWLGEVQGEAKERFFDSVDVLCARFSTTGSPSSS
jgi:hypothetical protein